MKTVQAGHGNFDGSIPSMDRYSAKTYPKDICWPTSSDCMEAPAPSKVNLGSPVGGQEPSQEMLPPFQAIYAGGLIIIYTISWACAAASLHWRKHNRRMCPCCPCWAAPVCVLRPLQKKAQGSGPKNGVAIQKSEPQLPNSRSPFWAHGLGARLSVKRALNCDNGRCSSMVSCAWLPRWWFHNKGTWCGRLFWSSSVV